MEGLFNPLSQRKILFQGSITDERRRGFATELCKWLACRAADHGCSLLLTGPSELEAIIARELIERCQVLRRPVQHHLSWFVCSPDSQLRLGGKDLLAYGSLFVLDKVFAYGSFARLRTILAQRADAVVTLGGNKGVLDIIEKMKLAQKPFLPIAVCGGESKGEWEQCSQQGVSFCDAKDFDALSDYNLTPEEMADLVFAILRQQWDTPSPKVFIVHGHDGTLKYELKDFLAHRCQLTDCVILQDEPSMGKTVIERFELYGGSSHIAFVILTPDDLVVAPGAGNGQRWRSRQNAILELGFFLGKLERTSGRVILLYKGDLELPSDISGLTYISIEHGIKAAGEEIRRELERVGRCAGAKMPAASSG